MYANNATMLIWIDHIVAIEFAIIAVANNYWLKDSFWSNSNKIMILA
ncbi:hexameric tyrosine-coordinated heme protein [Acinetobacter bereziniae]